MGKLTKEVADELGISIGTAFGYRSRIKSKLGLSSFAELIRYAVQANIVPSEPSAPDDSIVA
jgi:DNA-binding CsgD family transcriptional regulator